MITPEQRRAAVRALVAAEPPVPGPEPPGTVAWLRRLCRALVRELPASGAAITVMTSAGVQGVAAASDPATETLERLQVTLGEGPCTEAFSTSRPALEPDLDAAAAARRWPAYCAAALEAGIRAAFAFPLQVGAARLGVLGVYRRAPEVLSGPSLTTAVTFAEVAVEALLDGQERAPLGQAEATLDRALDSHYVVYQAQGIAMIDLGVSLADAMARLQAHAYAHDRPLHEVARDIVAGRLRLSPD